MTKFNLWDKETDSKITVDAEHVSGNNWKAICPNHDDHDPSLSIDAEQGLYNCFVCGYGGQLWDQTKRGINSRTDDPLDDEEIDPFRKPIATYDYCSTNGTLLYQVVTNRSIK
jgi:hypothetical protein